MLLKSCWCAICLQETTVCPCCCLRQWALSTAGTCWLFSSPTGTACRPTATWLRSDCASLRCSRENQYDNLGSFLTYVNRNEVCIQKLGMTATSVCLRYLLLSPQVWQSSESVVNVCSELDWKRCMAVHLWFMLPPTASVADALSRYEAAFQVSLTCGHMTGSDWSCLSDKCRCQLNLMTVLRFTDDGCFCPAGLVWVGEVRLSPPPSLSGGGAAEHGGGGGWGMQTTTVRPLLPPAQTLQWQVNPHLSASASCSQICASTRFELSKCVRVCVCVSITLFFLELDSQVQLDVKSENRNTFSRQIRSQFLSPFSLSKENPLFKGVQSLWQIFGLKLQ